MVRESPGLGEEIFKRGTVNLFQIGGIAVAGIQVIAEERPEIDLIEGIFLLGLRAGFVLLLDVFCVLALVSFFTSGDFIQQWNGGIQLLQHGVLHHFRVDHLLELQLVEREHAHHLDQPWSENLLLRDPQVQFVLE